MKKIVFIGLALALFSCKNAQSESQSSPLKTQTKTEVSAQQNSSAPTSPTSKEDKVKMVREEFAKINNDQSLKKKDFTWEGGDNGNCALYIGEVSKFTNANNELKKGIFRIGGDGASILYEFFYKDNDVMFVYSKHTYYPPMENAQPQISETRWYFENGQAFEHIIDNKNINANELLDNKELILKMGRDLMNANTTQELDKIAC